MADDIDPLAEFAASLKSLKAPDTNDGDLKTDLEKVFAPLLSGLHELDALAKAQSSSFAVEMSEPTISADTGLMRFDVVARVGINYGTQLEVGLKRNIAQICTKKDRTPVGRPMGGYNADECNEALQAIQRYFVGTFRHLSA